MDDDKAFADYSAEFRATVLPALLGSDVYVSIQPHGEQFDLRQATELGIMLLLDKPVLLVVLPGRAVPSRLAKAADVVVTDFDPADPASQDRFAAAVKTLSALAEAQQQGDRHD